jgi:protoporphyrinogen oxidase
VIEFGGEVRMRHRVVGLERRDGRAVAVQAWTPDGDVRLEGDHFISTMPLGELIRTCAPEAPMEVRLAGDGLRYRDLLVVALILRQRDLFPDNWIYIHTPGVRVGRIQNLNNWSRAMVPDSTTSCVNMEYFCSNGDDLWTRQDEDLITLAQRELAELGLARPSVVVDGTVVRMPKAYPVYDSTYRAHLTALRSWLDAIPNLHTIGRNGMHKYNNQDHSMLTAMFALDNMRGATHDLWAVNTDYEYHEVQRVPESSALRVARDCQAPATHGRFGSASLG